MVRGYRILIGEKCTRMLNVTYRNKDIESKSYRSSCRSKNSVIWEVNF